MRTLRQWLVLALAISSLVLATGCADDSSTTDTDGGNAGQGGSAGSTGTGGDAGGIEADLPELVGFFIFEFEYSHGFSFTDQPSNLILWRRQNSARKDKLDNTLMLLIALLLYVLEKLEANYLFSK